MCFGHFDPFDAQFRCINVRCKGRKPDTVYADHQGLLSAPLMGNVFPMTVSRMQRMTGRLVTSAECPTCNQQTFKRVCPTCHYELTQDAGMVEERIIAVIGGRTTGKSNYIAALVHKLEHEVGANFKAGILARGDNTRDRYDKDFYDPLFIKKKVIPPTQSGSVDSRTKVPMVFRITFPSNHRVANLVLFDTAGEDLQTLDTMSTEAKYILFADAIIFLLDPLQIDSIREKLPETSLPKPDAGAEPRRIIERLRELFEQQHRLKPTQKVTTPIAFTLSKIDMLESIVDPSAAFLRKSGEHFGYLNLPDLQSVNTDIVGHLQRWMGTALTSLVETNFSNYVFCAVSALGKMPKGDEINGVSPIRVEDPLLWIFNQFGLIKAKTK